MQNIILTLLALLFIGLIMAIFLMLKNRSGEGDGTSLLLLQQHIQDLNKNLQTSLSESVRHQQFGSQQMTTAVRDVTERLVKLEETNKQILSFSGQLENLQRILTNPKQRGILGEYYLETLLKNVFPPGMYQMQYKLGKDENGCDLIVDAVIFIKDKIIPIDSKFSLENYNRIREELDPMERERLEKLFKQDLKNRIDETSKYVRPEEGTMDFAFMFIPAEGIYYDLLVNQVGTIKVNTRDLIEYAFIEKKVHIVSPTTFLAHLKMVLQGLRALQVEESAKEIIKRVQDLGRHLKAYDQYFQNVGKHLGTTVNQYNLAGKELGKIDKDVLKIAGTNIGIEPQLVDKPNEELTA